jgi:flagellin-like protein
MNPQKRKAVSPVIATVILVAVAITVAVGVSYWMGGIIFNL